MTATRGDLAPPMAACASIWRPRHHRTNDVPINATGPVAPKPKPEDLVVVVMPRLFQLEEEAHHHDKERIYERFPPATTDKEEQG